MIILNILSRCSTTKLYKNYKIFILSQSCDACLCHSLVVDFFFSYYGLIWYQSNPSSLHSCFDPMSDFSSFSQPLQIWISGVSPSPSPSPWICSGFSERQLYLWTCSSLPSACQATDWRPCELPKPSSLLEGIQYCRLWLTPSLWISCPSPGIQHWAPAALLDLSFTFLPSRSFRGSRWPGLPPPPPTGPSRSLIDFLAGLNTGGRSERDLIGTLRSDFTSSCQNSHLGTSSSD